MPAITINDLNNAKRDVDHIAEVATSTAPTATDRLGHVKKTLHGAVDTIAAITVRGAWAPDTAYSVKDVVQVGATWYIAVVTHTSGSAFPDDMLSWRVYQGEVFTADVPGAVPRMALEKLSERKSLADCGAVGVLTVHVPSEFATLQAAIDSLHPLNLKPNEYVDIVIESGHALTAGVSVANGDYSGFRISSVDAVVNLEPSFAYVDADYRCVMKCSNARAPVWNIMVDCGGQIGRALNYELSTAKVMPFKGAKNATYLNSDDSGAGLYAITSQIDAYRSIFTYNTRGFWLTRGTVANLDYAVADNNVYRGGYISRGCAVGWQYGSAKNNGTHGIHALRSIVMAEDFDASNCQFGFYASTGATIDALNSVAKNCSIYGYVADSTSTVNARGTDASGAGTFGYFAGYGGRLDKTDGVGTVSSRENWYTRAGVITDNNAASFPNRTENANGVAIKYADGTMICYFRVTATYLSASQLRAVWTYPVAFVSEPRLQLSLRSRTTAPGMDELGILHQDLASATSTNVDLYRQNGKTNFVSGNTAAIDCYAVGRWI